MELLSTAVGAAVGAGAALFASFLQHRQVAARDRATFRRAKVTSTVEKSVSVYADALTILHRLIINTGLHTVEQEEHEIEHAEMTLCLLANDEILSGFRDVREHVDVLYEGLRDLPHHVPVKSMDEMERRDLLRKRGTAARERGLHSKVSESLDGLSRAMRRHLDEMRDYAWSK